MCVCIVSPITNKAPSLRIHICINNIPLKKKEIKSKMRSLFDLIRGLDFNRHNNQRCREKEKRNMNEYIRRFFKFYIFISSYLNRFFLNRIQQQQLKREIKKGRRI